MKWIMELLSGGATSHMVRLPEPVDHAVIPVEVGEMDQVVLVADRILSAQQRASVSSAWEAGVKSGRPIVLDGCFEVKVLRNFRKPQ